MLEMRFQIQIRYRKVLELIIQIKDNDVYIYRYYFYGT